LAKAIQIATSEPPGPVHLDFPEDVAVSKAAKVSDPQRRTRKLSDLSGEIVGVVSHALRSARRPLLVTGLTFARSQAPLRLLDFIERQKIPFVTTLHGKGFLPEGHPNWAGVIGRARRTNVKAFTDCADLIIAVGYDPIEINYEEWVGKVPLIHISSEAAERGKNLRFRWNKACDLDAAIAALAGVSVAAQDWSAAVVQAHRRSLDFALRPQVYGFAPHQALDILRDRLSPDGILAYDVGAHTHQIASQWRTEYPKTLLATNGWSSMGYGMPAAFAAKMVHPERSVACVVGDGGFQMTAGELALARRLNLNVPVIVLNDGWLGLMKVKQERRHYPLSGVRLGVPPESPAHYFGVPCRPAKTPDEFRAALDWACARSGPSVIEAFVDAEAYSATVFD
jgi:acetolactate synthase-1/2/3 large subunit